LPHPSTPPTSPPSLHDALPIYLARGHPHPHARARVGERVRGIVAPEVVRVAVGADALHGVALRPAQAHAHHGDAEVARGLHEVADRKSTRLNSSHVKISYAVFC